MELSERIVAYLTVNKLTDNLQKHFQEIKILVYFSLPLCFDSDFVNRAAIRHSKGLEYD